MKNDYKSALDKIQLSDLEKEKARKLFYKMAPDNKKGRWNAMRKPRILKPCLAIAAGLAIVLAVNAAAPALQDKFIPNPPDKTNSGNYFSVIAYAKELTKTGKISPDTYSSSLYTVGIADGEISFSFDFPIECKGKNIDTITYEIEKGALQVKNEKGAGVVIEGEEVDKKLDVPMVIDHEKYHERYTKHYDTFDGWISTDSVIKKNDEFKQYKSFTVKYDNQSNDTTTFSVIDASDVWTAEKKNQYQNLLGREIHDLSSLSLKEQKKLYDFLTNNLGITCTVTYQDGSTETKNISVSNEIVRLSDIITDHEVSKEDDKEIVGRFYHLG